MIIITIDGPTASGKSTVARMLAQELGYYYICSGFLYRSLAYLLIHTFGYTEHTVHDIKIADIVACFDTEKFKYAYDAEHGERVFFDQQDITPYLKDGFIDKIASITSVNEQVRHYVTLVQHSIAQKYNIVIDGRDVGSVVFPHAQVKFFLTASIDVRAQRWVDVQKKRGNVVTLEHARDRVIDRDRRDTERKVGPMIVPDDALIVDNSSMTLEQTFETMLAYVYQKIGDA